ncbi:MAG: transporter [Akkermansiaceae bacterium]|nr:transporter [Akkermansiaceae bacterium]
MKNTIILLLSASTSIILAESPEKRSFNFFNPTPNHLLRELSPDRPDATESPLTVDAGRFALEASLFDYRRDNGAETYTYGQLNFKAGLTHDIDLQTIVDLSSDTPDGDGFGDVTLRLKYNVYGNDGGDSALALMPFVKVPTNTELSNEEWEGGLIIPWGISLTENTGAYVEYIGIAGEHDYQAYLAGGMNYAVNDDLILDFGVQSGLNSAAEDSGFFTGFTKRF